jgi:glycogen debranching enzyme
VTSIAETATVGAPGAVTVFEGSSFCRSGIGGDIDPRQPHGVFFEDTRIISGWQVLINGLPLEALAVMTPEPFRAVFVGRHPRDGLDDTELLVERQRRVATGLREDVLVRNYGREPVSCVLTIRIAADFADLFEVKDGRIKRVWDHSVRVDGRDLALDAEWHGHRRGVVITSDSGEPDVGGITFKATVPAQGTWSGHVIAHPVVDGARAASSFPVGEPLEESVPSRRFRAWRDQAPVVQVEDEALKRILERSQTDLGALRITDPANPARTAVAAGAPWFMALFGRDSLLASFMALPVDQSLALGTLHTLAHYQGTKVDPSTEEQPGRILHEVRLGVDTGLALGGGGVYYGTADATPLFVCLVGELCRWGFADDELRSLMPHVDRALAWIEQYGDRDGDGFVEYERLHDGGLANQGWKDSWDGITFKDGSLPAAPIALCEVQGYVYAAYVSRSLLARRAGDERLAGEWRDRAARLKEEFNRRFWLPDQGQFALALDRDKRPVDASASNIGHCLWTGIVDEDKAEAVAERLLAPAMFTGWGVRTLASDMGAYNPASYHNGSVWPHDNALIVAGLMRYGFVEHAQRIAVGLLEAADRFGGRLPELFCGFGRDEYPDGPVPYPTSCSPQAWATTTPLLLLRSLMRYDPCLPHDAVWLAPAMPPGLGRVRLDHVPLGGARVLLDIASDGDAQIANLPSGLTVHRSPRPLRHDLDHSAGDPGAGGSRS